MDNRRLLKYVTLADAKRKATTDLDKIKEEMAKLEEYLMDNMMSSGQQSVNINSHTVFLHRQLWSSAATDTISLQEALINEGHGDLVEKKVNSQRLSALVREYDQDTKCPKGDDGLPILPGELRDTVKITEKYGIRVRKSG